MCPCLPQKEAREFLEKEWNAQFWSRTTSLTEEEYIKDEENWERAMKYGYDAVNTARGFPPKNKEEEEVEGEDDDDDDDDDDEEQEEEKEAESPTDTAGNIATKPSKASGAKTEDVPKVRCGLPLFLSLFQCSQSRLVLDSRVTLSVFI